MELTKEEALKLHQELWDWLSKNPDESKVYWPGWKDFEENWVRKNMFCFACAGSNCCDDCLLEWPGIDCCESEADVDDGLFALWDRCGDHKERTRLAEQIRDLPLREDKSDD